VARILAGIASRTPIPADQRFAESLPLFLLKVFELFNFSFSVYQVVGKKLDDAQNEIAEVSVHGNFDYLLLLEDDHWGHKPEMLDALVKADVDVCSILQYSRWYPYFRACMLRDGNFKDGRPKFREALYTEGVHPCDLIPFGMCLIRTSVFERIPKPWFRMNQKKGYTDQAFCSSLMEAGIQPMACFDFTLPHRDITAENVLEKRRQNLYPFQQSRYREKISKKLGELKGVRV